MLHLSFSLFFIYFYNTFLLLQECLIRHRFLRSNSINHPQHQHRKIMAISSLMEVNNLMVGNPSKAAIILRNNLMATHTNLSK